MTRPTKDWTDEDIRIAANMYRAGKSCREIALVLGRTRSSVKGFIGRRRKIDPVKWHVIVRGKHSNQPCWNCFFGSGRRDPETKWKCPWPDGKPLDDWDAVPVPYIVTTTRGGKRYDKTYEIHSCPHFKEE